MNKRLVIALAALIVMFQALAVRAIPVRPQQEQPAPTGLALEVIYYKDRAPAFVAVPGPDSKLNGAWYAFFGHVASWQPPTGFLPVRAVNVLSRLEDGLVRIEVSVYVGVKHFEKELPIASYRVSENKKISVDGLRQYGVEPFEIKVIRVNPAPVNPPSIMSKTDSIAVVGVKVNNSTLPSYTVTLRNVSGKNVEALGVNVFADGRRNGSSMPFGKQGQPLIEAGKTHDIYVFGGKTVRPTQAGYLSEAPPNQVILIDTAVFDDGSYEGEAETAASFRGFKVGDKIQIPRLIELLEEALNSSDSNVATALEKLKTQAASLSIDVETDALNDLLREFPSFNEEAQAGVKDAIVVSLAGDRLEFLKCIQEFEKASTQSTDLNAFRAWLRDTKKRYEKWLSRLQSE